MFPLFPFADMDDECYSGSGRITIDPKCLTLHPPARNSRSSTMLSMSCTSVSPALNTAITELTAANTALLARGNHNEMSHHGNSSSLSSNNHKNSSGSSSSSSSSAGGSTNSGGNNNNIVSFEHLQLPQHLADMYDDNDCSSSMSSAREGSISPDICSDIEIDEAVIKDEPMSPDSSCPASPNSQISSMQQQLSLNLANLQKELLFDQKVRSTLRSISTPYAKPLSLFHFDREAFCSQRAMATPATSSNPSSSSFCLVSPARASCCQKWPSRARNRAPPAAAAVAAVRVNPTPMAYR